MSGLGVLGDVGQRLRDGEVGGRLGHRREPAVGQLDDLDGHGGARHERGDRGGETALGQQRGMDPAGQLAQLGRGRGELLADPLERGAGRVRVALGEAAREPHVQRERDEPLLRAVVEVALDPAAGVVGRLHDAGARCVQLRGPGRLDLLPAQRLLGLAPLGDVEDRAVHPAPATRARHELTAVEHPADLAVGAHDAVLEHERALLVDVAGDGLLDPGVVVGVDHAHQRPARAGDKAGGRVAGDALDLIGDQLEPVAGVPRRAVDRAGHGGQQ